MIIDHRYEVIESFGSGAWSNVYKVKDIRSNNLFTIKLFQYLSSADFYSRMRAEDMHHITKISHPNLSKIVDFGHVGDHIYTLAEYYDGISLANFKFRKSQLRLLYDIIIQITYALDELHEQDIIHKDLKPENVLYKIEKNKVELKVIDFGFNKTDSINNPQSITGSLPYIAPEVFSNGTYSRKSDYYSLGVLLYRITTGSLPFTVEQVNSLTTGMQQYFIPKFPSELNPDIPPALEKFILRCLERHPDNRFDSADDIINYVNRIQDVDYPYSHQWTMLNRLQNNDYISRQNLSHQLLEYLDSMENSNGKLVSLLGSEGMGKDSIVSLFRYHLLTGKFFLFDYNCTKTDHEPFFALIKEFTQSMSKDVLERYEELKAISEKFSKYLYTSPQEAKKITQNQEELRTDFQSVRNLLVELSKEKPIIFIVRNAHFIHKHTIDFINYISSTLIENRIMILLSFNDYQKIRQIQHTIVIQVPALTAQESKDYLEKLLNTRISKENSDKLWKLSAGNPYFMREILIDLVQKKKMVIDPEPRFTAETSDLKLPRKLIINAISRISHVKHEYGDFMRLLSVVGPPLTYEIISQVLGLNERELYEFLDEALFNEILVKKGNTLSFNYQEVKENLVNELDPSTQKKVSDAVISFFTDKRITDVETCQGLIYNSLLSDNLTAQRVYSIELLRLFEDINDQKRSLETIYNILKIDFKMLKRLPKSELLKDLSSLQDKLEITGMVNIPDDIIQNIKKIDDVFEKHFLLGTVFYLQGKIKQAKTSFTKAMKLAVTGKNKILAWFYFIQIYSQTDVDKMHEYLNNLSVQTLPAEFKISYYDRLALYYKLKGDVYKSIQISEDFISELPSSQDYRILLKMASLHNNLGVSYSSIKNIEEAQSHFNIALSIWKRFNINRHLALIYNNLADLYLKQGITTTSISYSQKGFEMAKELGLKIIMSLAQLNLGEAYIKTGEFQQSEYCLNQARELLKEVNSDRFQASITYNLALAKSKIKGFKYYHSFIEKQEPDLIKGVIKELNPLVKTYLYYLYELGHVTKLERIIRKNAHINYHEIHEDEFYFNTLSLIAMLKKDYTQALDYLKSAEKYAGAVNNHYALTVFHVSEIECYIGLKQYEKADELIDMASEIAEKYKYKYWELTLRYLKMHILLAEPEYPVRLVLRELNELEEESKSREYFLLRTKILLLKIKTLITYRAETEATEQLNLYHRYVIENSSGIPDEDKKHYLSEVYQNKKTISDLNTDNIAIRYPYIKSNWLDLQYNLMSIKNTDRVKFFIEKGIKDLFAPWHYKIMLYGNTRNTYEMFIGDISKADFLITSDVFNDIEKAFQEDTVSLLKSESSHIMIVPLQIKYHKIGFLIIADKNELDYTKFELSLVKSVKTHLTNLIIRIQDYAEVSEKVNLMNKLMSLTHSLIKIMDIRTLENEIVSAGIDMTGSSRGFLIKREEDGNYTYQVALDDKKAPLPANAVISKTVLMDCQQSKNMVFTYNAVEDNRYKNSISVQDYKFHSIFCAPIIVSDSIYGLIYLDNFLDNSKPMNLNSEIITLLIDQICVAIKNALQYNSILQSSQELQSLELLKDEFMAIISHELNTPLTTLQGYVSRLKRNLFADEEERNDIMIRIENSIKKLILTTNDIITMNNYNLKKELPKVPLNIADIINLIKHEIEIVSRHRNMIIKEEATTDLPLLEGNWEALHLMIYNIVLNAIRFTNDFGTINIGVRKSAFQEEKINNRETLVIYVQDNGIGIPASQIKNVFRKFYEVNEIYAHKSGTVEYRSSGLGLGLSTSKRIAELHQGKIWIKSKENEGTTVFISLPIKDTKERKQK